MSNWGIYVDIKLAIIIGKETKCEGNSICNKWGCKMQFDFLLTLYTKIKKIGK